ncbi:MAG: sigma-70 family RNA polymerase sigma factor [Planctomycetota bacterium]
MPDAIGKESGPDGTGAGALPTTMLLERARGRDGQALAEILRRLQPRIEHLVRRASGPAVKARYETVDLRQDVMMELLEYLPRVKIADSRALENYLVTVIRNTLCDTHAKVVALRRSLSRERPLPSDSVLELDPPRGHVRSPSGIIERREQEAWLRLALPLLPPDDQEVFIRAKLRLETYPALARELGATPDAVRMRVGRIMGRLLRIIVELKDGRIDELLHS